MHYICVFKPEITLKIIRNILEVIVIFILML